MSHDFLTAHEKQVFGRQTRVQVVRADQSDPRPWLHQAPVCAALARHHIAHVGIMSAQPPLEIVRTNLSGSFFLACFQGAGQVLVDGQWQEITASIACIQPPGIPNAIRATRQKPWEFCWVRYQESPRARPIVSLHAPALAEFNPASLRAAIEGLHAEASADQTGSAISHWLELIHGYVRRFVAGFQTDDRLQQVWDEVERNLAAAWTLARMAHLAGVSKEHLRRLTLGSVGRTPLQHVAFLRMHQAAKLLAASDVPIAQIAEQVGYATPFAFSDAFLHWFGCRPTDYRARCG